MTDPEAGDDHDAALGRRPLTARSVILSTLLGSHPPVLPVRTLVRVGDLFGIADGTVRVALSRMAAEGDVRASDGQYRLSDRLVARQRRLDESRRPETRPWRGAWELAVLHPGAAGPPDGGAAVAADAAELRLAVLRDGVLTRPANLARTWPAAWAAQSTRFEARPEGNPAELAGRLWDLDGWAAGARALQGALADATEPARRFVVGAAILRHLRQDPILPDALLPADWPGAALRRDYRTFEREMARLLADQPAGREASARQSAT